MESADVIVEPNELHEFGGVHLIIREGNNERIDEGKGKEQQQADAKRGDEKGTGHAVGDLFPFRAAKSGSFHKLIQILPDFRFYLFEELIDGDAVRGIVGQ